MRPLARSGAVLYGCIVHACIATITSKKVHYNSLFDAISLRRRLNVYNICYGLGMVLLENDAFLVELNKLFEKSRVAGSVSLTIKRFNGHNKPQPREGRPPLPAPSEYLCLVRAKHKSKKLSTIIHSKDVNKFQQAYWNLLKTNINGLKKLKKGKSAKPKAQ